MSVTLSHEEEGLLNSDLGQMAMLAFITANLAFLYTVLGWVGSSRDF